MKQKIKVTNKKTGESVFFFDHSFKSAKYHADKYIERNGDGFVLYNRNSSSFGNTWLEAR